MARSISSAQILLEIMVIYHTWTSLLPFLVTEKIKKMFPTPAKIMTGMILNTVSGKCTSMEFYRDEKVILGDMKTLISIHSKQSFKYLINQ